MQTENANLYHILSWVCLGVGWLFGLAIFTFPLGIYLANRARKEGTNATISYVLNLLSLMFIVMIGLMLFLAGGLSMIFY